MIYPTLYSKSETGATLVWWMELEENAHEEGGYTPTGFYRSHSGQVDGKITVSDWTEVYGKNKGKKNETDGYEQAMVEIKAKYTKKEKEGYVYNLDEIGKAKFIQPMLAKNFKDYKDKISYPVFVQCKYNGFRCIATKDGLFTRTGEKYVSVPHIEKALAPIFKKFPRLVLDGELFNNELRQNLNEISKLVRKTINVTEEDLNRSKEIVKYYIYDYIPEIITSKGYDDRSVDLVTLNDWAMDNYEDEFELYMKSIVFAETYIADDYAKVETVFNMLVEEGHEGVMIRLNAPYEQKRSKNLLKFKPEDDAEFTLTDVQEGKGNWAGKAKRVCLKDSNGKEFDGSFKGTMEEAEEFLNNKDKYIGKQVTIKYFGFTGLGVPNYAQFDYKNQKELI